MQDLILRISCCAAAGFGCGVASLAWIRRLVRNRELLFPLSRRASRILIAAAVLLGGAVGGLTSGIVPPICGLLLMCICITASVIDWTHRIIPNDTILALLALALAGGLPTLFGLDGFLPFNLWLSLAGLAACFAVFALPGLFGKQVGAGDVKLAAAMGFFLGLGNALLGVVLMGALVILYSCLQRKLPILEFLKTQIPMGPFITAGLFVVYLGSFYLG